MSKIQWTEKTWNPVAGCSLVSPGCKNCYAMRMAARLEAMGQTKYAGTTKKVNGLAVWTGKINLDEQALTIPLRTKRPTTWFVNSMSDLFHEGVPFEFIDKVFAVMALTPHHTYQILTKRPERMAEYTSSHDVGLRWAQAADGYTIKGSSDCRAMVGPVEAVDWTRRGLPGVWLGTSIEDRKRLDERAMELAKCPAAVPFWSLEPLLEDLGNIRGYLEQGVKWVIVGGESGPGARPCNVDWIRSIVRQCKAAGVACFVKQLGLWIIGSHEFEGWQGSIDRWRLRDEKGGESTWHRPVLRSDYCPMLYDERPQNAVAWGLGDPKGGDMTEWPADLRVREMPMTHDAPRHPPAGPSLPGGRAPHPLGSAAPLGHLRP